MVEVIREEQRKARKPHTCSYCGEVIQPGETYDYTVLRYDDMYEWKSHTKCSFIAQALWEYIGPDEGMTAENFDEGCTDFCRAFICPHCPDADIEAEGCKLDKTYCVDKIYEFLQTHDFRRVKDEHGWGQTFKCFPKEKNAGTERSRTMESNVLKSVEEISGYTPEEMIAMYDDYGRMAKEWETYAALGTVEELAALKEATTDAWLQLRTATFSTNKGAADLAKFILSILPEAPKEADHADS